VGAAGGWGFGAVPPRDRVRLGIIGTGRQGRGLIGSFMKQPDAELAVLCDVYRPSLDDALRVVARRDSERAAPQIESDFRRVLERKDIDAVVIGSPDHWHALMTVEACRAGKDVYVEKPTAVAIEEGAKMVEAARKYKRVVQVGTQQRSGAHFQKAVEVVRSGALGKITFVRTWNNGNLTPDGYGNPPDGAARRARLGHVARPRAAAPLQRQSLRRSARRVLDLPLVLGLRGRDDDRLGGAPARHRALGDEGRLAADRDGHGRQARALRQP
jgi:hypothetical protein